MGCCSSTESLLDKSDKKNNLGTKKEDKIELAFKVKRANIFTEGVDFGRDAFCVKKIPKTEKQSKLISNSIYNNIL